MAEPGGTVVIIGAGPAGLTAARELRALGRPVIVLERNPVYVGGIARTEQHHGYRFDIGGHRFFSKNAEIERLWSEILGTELLQRDRLSRMYYRGRFFAYPIRAANALRQLGPVEASRCFVSYARARLHPVADPVTLEDWVSNQFGKRLYEIFFKTYNEKVWGMPANEISADFAAQRIKGLDMKQLILSALRPNHGHGSDGGVIKTLIDSFRYPRLGPGELWERVAADLAAGGYPVRLGREVVRVCWERGRVTRVVTRDAHGVGEATAGAEFVSTMPIRDLVRALDPVPPDEVREAARQLSYRDFLTVALIVDAADLFPDNWIYIHDPDVRVGRLQNFKNWSPDMVPDPTRTCVGMEYFCFEGDGLWASSDEELIGMAASELAALGLARREQVVDGAVVRQAKAYPVYDDSYQRHLRVVREWLTEELPNLQLCGRNGMHKYNNQDHSMLTALIVARRIAGVSDLDPWRVNADAEYLEGGEASGKEGGRAVATRVGTRAGE
ncbi:MAG: NAD(P)/FAD-dependent oxidoreductase, partial [Candidatus Dormibacteraceae bacterium]